MLIILLLIAIFDSWSFYLLFGVLFLCLPLNSFHNLGIFFYLHYFLYFSCLVFSTNPSDVCKRFSGLCLSGDYKAAIKEHQQELSLSEALGDVIGRAVAHRKIGECYAEMGNIESALKVSRF